VAVPADTELVIPTGEVFILVVENVCDAAVIPFKVYSPLLPHVALPYASDVNTAFDVIVPPVTLIVFVTSEVVVKVPVLIEVEDIFPEDVKDVAVINPAAKPPLPSRFTIVFAVLEEVAEFTADDTVVIVDDKTPPTLFTTGAAAVPPKSFVNCIIPLAVDDASVADIVAVDVPDTMFIPVPADKAPCFALSS
jgi:hypothetical protein